MGLYEDIRAEFASLPQKYDASQADGVDVTIEAVIEGEGGGTFTMSLYKKHLIVEETKAANPNMRFYISSADFVRIINGEADPMSLAMSGAIHLEGDRSLGIRLQAIIEGTYGKNS